MLAGLQVPFLGTETHELTKELVASYLYQVHLTKWPLESVTVTLKITRSTSTDSL